MARGGWTVWELLKRWDYAAPLLVNLTGSVWFFVVVGQAGRFGIGGGVFFFGGGLGWGEEREEGEGKGEGRGGEDGDGVLGGWEEIWLTRVGCVELSLTVPITNSLAFLFTVLGEWWAEGKVISRGEFSPFVGVVDFSLSRTR